MRINPFVCFEVDSMLNMANWESVIVWGYFEELDDKEANKGREYLYNSILDLLTSLRRISTNMALPRTRKKPID